MTPKKKKKAEIKNKMGNSKFRGMSSRSKSLVGAAKPVKERRDIVANCDLFEKSHYSDQP